jgi:hypothetical protein
MEIIMAKGGARIGAGRKPGQKNRLTVERKRSLREIADAYTDEAINTLATIMKDPKAPHAARATAANSILDRAHGKPKQPVDHELNLDNLTNDQLAALALALGAPPSALGGLGDDQPTPSTH